MKDVIKETIERCRAAGLRRTKALEELIRTLLESNRPMTLAELADEFRVRAAGRRAQTRRIL